jgi:putative peptide zinc metalloprotease protein
LGLWIAVGGMFLLHEAAHGVTCTHFGGRVREAGFMVLCFLPCFYTNVSDAWLFPKRAHRVWVMLAGVFFESFLWSVAVLVWRLTAPEALVHSIALAIVISSGASILFNLNPLIKLDGYYVLSDLLAIPNLRARSLGYVGWRFRELLTGRPVLEAVSARERRIYWAYGITAVLYTAVLMAMMIFLLGRYLVSTFGGLGWALFAFILAAALRQPVYFLGSRIMSTAKEIARPPGRRRLVVIFTLLAVAVTTTAFVRGELRVKGSRVGLEDLLGAPALAARFAGGAIPRGGVSASDGSLGERPAGSRRQAG